MLNSKIKAETTKLWKEVIVMAIVKWNPLDDVVSFQRRIDKMFEDTFLWERALEEEELSGGMWSPSVE